MAGRDLDALARELARGASRRRLLKQILGGVGGGAIALAGVAGAAGQTCRMAGSLCNRNANCCSGRGGEVSDHEGRAPTCCGGRPARTCPRTGYTRTGTNG